MKRLEAPASPPGQRRQSSATTLSLATFNNGEPPSASPLTPLTASHTDVHTPVGASSASDGVATSRRRSSVASVHATPLTPSSFLIEKESSAHFVMEIPSASPDQAESSPKDSAAVAAARKHPPSLLLSVVKEVTSVFAPVVAYDSKGRRVSHTASRGSVPPVDPELLMDLRPHGLVELSLAASLTAKQQKHAALQQVLSPRSAASKAAGGASTVFASSMMGGSMNMDHLALSIASDGLEDSASTTSPTSGMADYWEPPEGTPDPFEDDIFSPETRRGYQLDKAKDEALDCVLAHYRLALQRRQIDVARASERKVFGSNVRYLCRAGMWQAIVEVLRYGLRARNAFAEEMYTQEVIKQMAPLCAIRLRQRLKKTKIRKYLPIARRPSLEVFKADRTLSHFPEEQLEKLRERMELKCFFRHESLLYRGTRDDECYVMEQGLTESRDGCSVLSVYRKNHMIGTLGMISGEPRLHSVIAATEVYVWVIKRSDFEATLNPNDAKTKNALQVVNELRQKNIRDVFHDLLMPSSMRQFLLFAGIRDTVLENLVMDASARVFKRGDVILRGGEDANHAVLVIQGRVRLSVVPQMELPLEQGIQQHVAEVVCLHRPRHSSRATQQQKEFSGVIMRGDGAPMSPAIATPQTKDVCGIESSPLSMSMSAAANASGTAQRSSFGSCHSIGMACDIACAVLIDVPALVQVGAKHRFQCTALSDSVDCLVFSADRLKGTLLADRETRRAFDYNLTCLALPFIQPLPRHVLLQTLWPRSFAFDFLPKLPVETLEQIPVVFAADDVISIGGEADAMAIVVLKGDFEGCTGLQKPYMWPEVPFVCLPSATAIRRVSTKVLTAIEGVLVRRSDVIDLLGALRPSERQLLYDAMKARLAAKMGSASTAMVSSESTTTKKGEKALTSGDQRIKMAVYGTMDELDAFKDAAGSPSSPSKPRMNPLIRAELGAVRVPRHPDLRTPIKVAIDARLRVLTQHEGRVGELLEANSTALTYSGSPVSSSKGPEAARSVLTVEDMQALVLSEFRSTGCVSSQQTNRHVPFLSLTALCSQRSDDREDMLVSNENNNTQHEPCLMVKPASTRLQRDDRIVSSALQRTLVKRFFVESEPPGGTVKSPYALSPAISALTPHTPQSGPLEGSVLGSSVRDVTARPDNSLTTPRSAAKSFSLSTYPLSPRRPQSLNEPSPLHRTVVSRRQQQLLAELNDARKVSASGRGVNHSESGSAVPTAASTRLIRSVLQRKEQQTLERAAAELAVKRPAVRK